MADVVTLHCTGRLLRGEAVNTLRNAAVSAKVIRTILLDLSEVCAIDAGGVNALVALRNSAADWGIQVRIVNPSSFVREVVKRFQLDRILEISTLRDALVILSGRACPEAALAC